MTAPPADSSRAYSSRTALDIAMGILIAHRGCTLDAALDELATAAHASKISLVRAARELIEFSQAFHHELPARDLAAAAVAWRQPAS
ncbi:ANTAR domain-containing protein [Rhodococcus rhodnii]|uniref:ANTAR domain-containing protein n=2 Tax=Rhodococcus rhodnii TaxID=38312 RepID=R7WPU1_9NOCA|nr:ANTAR domain-containing protein [Rhodococcus rhodnii]EOM77331.1 hypothetical protein Rrhod_1284 [Rhodococcus rhodnii LMG 5362]TXG91708.1 ANTAR domain-containing protein [Rhodococcus rhodnii]